MNREATALLLSICVVIACGVREDAVGANWNPLSDTGQNDCYDSGGNVVSPCVPAGQDGQYHGQAPSFTDNGETITDNNTGLIWQKDADIAVHNWAAAIALCEALEIGSLVDWQLPEKYELQSIVDYGRSNPAIDTTYFNFNGPAVEYWTRTPAASSAEWAWFVDFYDGDDKFNGPKTDAYSVRCVHPGP